MINKKIQSLLTNLSTKLVDRIYRKIFIIFTYNYGKVRENKMFDYKSGLSALKKASKSFPNGSGIYKFLEKNHTVLYVGKAKNLKKKNIFLYSQC